MYAIYDRWAAAWLFTFADSGPETLTFSDRLDAVVYMAANDLDDTMPNGEPRFEVERREWSAVGA